MSEDREKKTHESRAVTSDEHNKASSYAVNKPAGRAGGSSDADLAADDEILDLIRKRQEEKKTAPEPVSEETTKTSSDDE